MGERKRKKDRTHTLDHGRIVGPCLVGGLLSFTLHQLQLIDKNSLIANKTEKHVLAGISGKMETVLIYTYREVNISIFKSLIHKIKKSSKYNNITSEGYVYSRSFYSFKIFAK